MNKSSFLTLVAASLVCGAAFAQSGPVVYGVADLSVESASATGATVATNDVPSRTRLQANSSLLGVKGKFTIDGNLAAIYQFETYVDLGNNQYGSAGPSPSGTTTIKVGGLVGGTTSVFGARRDTFVGLTGDFGTLKAGYLTTGFRGAVAKCDLAPGATGVAASYQVFGFAANPNAASGGGGSYFNRYPAVNYSTPVMGGFSGAFSYIVDTAKSANNATNQVDPGGWDILARYENKLFHVTFVHTDLKDTLFGSQAAEANKSEALMAGVNFPTGTTLSLMYNTSKADLTPTPAAAQNEYKQTSFYVGIKQVVGPHEFMVAYQSAAKTQRNGVDVVDSGATELSARYAYNVAKNISVYGVYSAISNEKASAYNFNIGAINGLAAGGDPAAFGIGLRVAF